MWSALTSSAEEPPELLQTVLVEQCEQQEVVVTVPSRRHCSTVKESRKHASRLREDEIRAAVARCAAA